jgi:hypothetical protein
VPHPGTGHRRQPLPGRRQPRGLPAVLGHRFCPQCQHAAGATWLERQRAKLLPVDYDLITFTLPATWRALVYDHQREAYDLLIRTAWQTRAAFGLGDKALTFLGRYLYRGVLPEKNILRHADGQVTFRYTDNKGTHQTRTLAGADFLWRLLAHVLPKGVRRRRDYGFLHANGKGLMRLRHRVLPRARPTLRTSRGSLCSHELSLLVRRLRFVKLEFAIAHPNLRGL